jgi:hypothetical protein
MLTPFDVVALDAMGYLLRFNLCGADNPGWGTGMLAPHVEWARI